MTLLQEGCRAAILSYADEEMQRNAILLDEHTEFVKLVLHLFRDEYRRQANSGNTVFVTPIHIEEYLDSIKPY